MVRGTYEAQTSLDVWHNLFNSDQTDTPNCSICVAIFQWCFQDVFLFLRSREVALSTKFNYMEKQPDITMNMRQILVDWLVEVSEEYKLQTETLHLAVNYIDRYRRTCLTHLISDNNLTFVGFCPWCQCRDQSYSWLAQRRCSLLQSMHHNKLSWLH